MTSLEFYRSLTSALERGERLALLTITKHANSDVLGTKTILYPNGDYLQSAYCADAFTQQLLTECMPYLENAKSKAVSFSWENTEVECFVEVFLPPLQLIIAGAGHVSEPTAAMAKMLGFYVSIIDDRESFANPQRFTFVDKVICEPYYKYFHEVEMSPDTFVLLLTRGHQFDVICLRELLRKEEQAAYIGMIGSKRRISGVFEQLKHDFPAEAFANIYTPVGLDIGAQTPGEIAVSMMAEIIKVKNRRTGKSLREEIPSYRELNFRGGANQ